MSAIMSVCHKLTIAGLQFDDEWTGLFMLAGLPDLVQACFSILGSY